MAYDTRSGNGVNVLGRFLVNRLDVALRIPGILVTRDRRPAYPARCVARRGSRKLPSCSDYRPRRSVTATMAGQVISTEGILLERSFLLLRLASKGFPASRELAEEHSTHLRRIGCGDYANPISDSGRSVSWLLPRRMGRGCSPYASYSSSARPYSGFSRVLDRRQVAEVRTLVSEPSFRTNGGADLVAQSSRVSARLTTPGLGESRWTDFPTAEYVSRLTSLLIPRLADAHLPRYLKTTARTGLRLRVRFNVAPSRRITTCGGSGRR
ncbi:hypothetical protein R1flu_001720 [Riccia fluitans]|uniref:Uncharacterized protein n=1 Tax=Riccia fluitans TaxID=41844 RepID=A0ABD1Y4J3_9MARC